MMRENDQQADSRGYVGDDAAVTMYFTGRADRYARHRPGYPADAIAFILSRAGKEAIVADVGCGTGISTRALAEGGAAEVIGIEPNDDMRASAAAAEHACPERAVRYVAGTAEATGLAASSVHAVVCAQAFHWFDAAQSLREFSRSVKPGGVVALMWNVRDESGSPASAEYERVIRLAQAHAIEQGRVVRHNRTGDVTTGGFFCNPVERAFENPARYTLEELLGRAHSSSYYPSTGPYAAELDDQLRELFQRFNKGGIVTLEQNCHVTVAERTSRSAQ